MKIVEINHEVAELVKNNDGYCICAVVKDKTTVCPCEDFIAQDSGECYCGRFEKVDEE